jgi:uncharacterized membrane protein (UPF0127 family)
MGRRDLSQAYLLIPDCGSIHTCFMLGAIDILFLDREHRVVGVRGSLKPWRFLGAPKGTRDVLELPPGYAHEHGIESGDVIECQLG